MISPEAVALLTLAGTVAIGFFANWVTSRAAKANTSNDRSTLLFGAYDQVVENLQSEIHRLSQEVKELRVQLGTRDKLIAELTTQVRRLNVNLEED